MLGKNILEALSHRSNKPFGANSMWLLYFVNALQSSLTSNLSAYITSEFSEHSLLTVISVVTSVMGAACVMPIAKVLNIWDRSVGIGIMVLIAIAGLIMMASCKNIATYCAAQVSSSKMPQQSHRLTAPASRHSTQSVSLVLYSASTCSPPIPPRYATVALPLHSHPRRL